MLNSVCWRRAWATRAPGKMSSHSGHRNSGRGSTPSGFLKRRREDREPYTARLSRVGQGTAVTNGEVQNARVGTDSRSWLRKLLQVTGGIVKALALIAIIATAFAGQSTCADASTGKAKKTLPSAYAPRPSVSNHVYGAPIPSPLVARGPAAARAARARAHFRRTHLCPSTHRSTGACPGYVLDHADSAGNLRWKRAEVARQKSRLD